MPLPRKQTNLSTAGQYEPVSPSALEDEVGWTSQAPSRRPARPRRSKKSQAKTSYDIPKPTRPKRQREGHIPRPPNAFIIFRSEYLRNRPSDEPEDKTLSGRIGAAWKNLPEHEKRRCHKKAEEEKEEHARRHPDYKYKPSRPKNKVKKQTKVEREIEKSSVTFHSANSSPDPTPAPSSNPVSSNVASLASLRVPPLLPSDRVAITTAPVHPEIVQRKQSFRLSSWDDSVIDPRELSNSFHYPSQGDHPASMNAFNDATWEALRRQSSSAPLPNYTVLSGPDSVVHSFQPDAYIGEGDVMTFSDPSRRNSYSSGIRPGFVYQDTNFSNEDKTNGNVLTTFPIKPIIAQPVDLGYPAKSDATIAPASLINPQPALSEAWSSAIDVSQVHPLSFKPTANPFMFTSPMQPSPFNLHLNAEGTDRQFNQRWLEMSFCTSPEQMSFSNPTVQAVPATSANPDVLSAETKVSTSKVSEVEQKPVAEQVSGSVIPRQVHVGQAPLLNKHWSSFNPYAYKPQKLAPPPQIQGSILVEDLFKAGPSSDSYMSGFDQSNTGFENAHPSSSEVYTESTMFPSVSMDPLLNFYPISYDYGSQNNQGLGSSWTMFNGAVEA